jgi:hypothetical protein
VVPGVPTLRAGGVVLPEHLALGVANRENVFSIGSTDQNEAVFFGMSDGRK